MRIKNRSLQASESTPLIGGDYGKNASKNNIPQDDKKVKGNLLLSEKDEVDYLKAVKLGDMETAQKMVDEAASI